jgi:hypothetical protein
MGMNYSMVLVPSDPNFHPGVEAISRFLGGLVEMGAAGVQQQFALMNYQKSGLTFVGRDRKTGSVVGPERTQLGSLTDLQQSTAGVTDFDAQVRCVGPFKVMPIRNVGSHDGDEWLPLEHWLDVTGSDLELIINCCQRGNMHSTSDLHEDPPQRPSWLGRLLGVPTPNAEAFGHPCELGSRMGLYANPETAEVIEVPNAGYSTFWVSIELLNKGMFPKFEENKIDFVERSVMKLAESTFGVRFAEGCCWG